VLILVTGPIASGKTTVAAALGDRLRATGHGVAVLDLDDLVLSIGGWRDLSWERFEQSFDALGQLVAAWLAAGLDVIAHGPFFERNAMEAVLRDVRADVPLFRVMLLASYEIALERVAADPDRDLSKDPERLRAAYLRAVPMLESMPPSEWTFDTGSSSASHIVDVLMAAFANGTGPAGTTPPK
jgi:predicted kinase